MPIIKVIKGVKYRSEVVKEQIDLKKTLFGKECSYIGELYSPCWLFAFEAAFILNADRKKHTGYLSGIDELYMTPGTIKTFPEYEEKNIDGSKILPDKLTSEIAENTAWDYSKKWIIKNNRILHRVPVKTCTHTDKLYKPLIILQFQNSNGSYFKAMDSLTGDMEDILIV